MPKVIEIKGYKFFFFSNEGDPAEPIHIHVRKGNCLAKFWLDPAVRFADSIGFNARELRFLEKTVNDNKVMFMEAWYEFFG